MKRTILVIAAVLSSVIVLSLAYLLLWPVPIDPVAWEAPNDVGLTGPYAPNTALAAVHRLEVAEGHGPEDVAEGPDGLVYGGIHEGKILRWAQDGGDATLFAETGGRPLGLHFDAQANLIVADAFKGLLSIDPSGSVTTLCTHASDGTPLVFTDDLDIANDGTVWFSDASTKFEQSAWKNDLLENRPNGRLLRWHADTGRCDVALADLYFANGVAIAPDQSFVLVNETSRYRVRRLWLTGPRAGTNDIFIDNLPGFNDGISTGVGRYWIALASPRNPLVDGAAGQPWLRSVMVRLPTFLQPAPSRHPFALGVDPSGKVVHNLQDPQGLSFGMVTSVQEHGDRLYLGSLAEPAASWIPTPESSP